MLMISQNPTRVLPTHTQVRLHVHTHTHTCTYVIHTAWPFLKRKYKEAMRKKGERIYLRLIQEKIPVHASSNIFLVLEKKIASY